MTTSPRRVFVLRIWHEGHPVPEGESVLRGSLQDTRSSQIHYFQSLAGLLALLENWLQQDRGTPR